MPTFGRADYVAESIAMFLEQDYPNKELIIVNDCPGQTLEGRFPNVRIINSPARWQHLGDKRNHAIELSNGEFIAVWDDDDVYLPWRLSHTVQQIRERKLAFYCTAEYWAYWGKEILEDNASVSGWIWHPSFAFPRKDWKAVGGYPSVTLGEDSIFLERLMEHRSVPWDRCPISKVERFLIMRGCSKYRHTSIAGGQHPPDTRPGTILLEPCGISDPLLHRARRALVDQRIMSLNRRQFESSRALHWPLISPDAERQWLSELTPTEYQVGYGEPGFLGQLGYEGKMIEVSGVFRERSLSTHAPARLTYDLDDSFHFLCCHVALNDDVPFGLSAADFFIYADGHLCGVARNVRSGHPPRILQANIRGARKLILTVQPYQWDFCHTVWVDPFLTKSSPEASGAVLIDPLRRAEINVPARLPKTELCIATVGSAGFEDWVDDLLGSVNANAQCPGALLVIFSIDDSVEIARVAAKYNAVVIPCRRLSSVNPGLKSVLYSIAKVVSAEKFICLDADMLVLDDLRPVINAIDASPPGSVLICREAKWSADLKNALLSIYRGQEDSLTSLSGYAASEEACYGLVVNDGLLAGSAAALNAIDDQIRGFNRPIDWMDDPVANVPWRNQFLLNLALAQARSGVELDSKYNVQLQVQSISVESVNPMMVRDSRGVRATVVHFNGGGRRKSPEIRGCFSRVTDPLIGGKGAAPEYDSFLVALRRWLGTKGHSAMAWSFYGQPDGGAGRNCNPERFSLYETLYSIVRSNGCRRVIETGTARGISAACLATAVSCWPDAAVVTIDVGIWPEREGLWQSLPLAVQSCIYPRQDDAINCLRSELAKAECYDAALLDSVHTQEHVLREFQLARQIVCTGGLILIHDAIWSPGTVGEALKEIELMGFNVVRLWTADHGRSEDAGLGLAVIENRIC